MRDQIKNPLLGGLLSGHNDKMAEKKCAPKGFCFFRRFVAFLYMVFFSALQFVKTSTEYPKILFNYCDHARIILNFSKNICSIFVTFPKSDRRRKYTMLNYKE